MKTIVHVIESDSWSGKKLLEKKEYKTLRGAKAFMKRYNAQNNLPQVPEYYTYAILAEDNWEFQR